MSVKRLHAGSREALCLVCRLFTAVVGQVVEPLSLSGIDPGLHRYSQQEWGTWSWICPAVEDAASATSWLNTRVAAIVRPEESRGLASPTTLNLCLSSALE